MLQHIHVKKGTRKCVTHRKSEIAIWLLLHIGRVAACFNSSAHFNSAKSGGTYPGSMQKASTLLAFLMNL